MTGTDVSHNIVHRPSKGEIAVIIFTVIDVFLKLFMVFVLYTLGNQLWFAKNLKNRSFFAMGVTVMAAMSLLFTLINIFILTLTKESHWSYYTFQKVTMYGAFIPVVSILCITGLILGYREYRIYRTKVQSISIDEHFFAEDGTER